MEFNIKIDTAQHLALRDPERTKLGRNIVRKGLVLMHEIGLEQFTFKKLAIEIDTTEASVYRYFENKHRFLLYLLTWYWSYLDYLVMFNLQNMTDSKEKIKKIIYLLVYDLPDGLDQSGFDKPALSRLVINESSKAYLVRDVEEINQIQLFKPYKDLCGRIAGVIQEYAPGYPYPRSLSSTLLEMSHLQYYFMLHLPSLTDSNKSQKPDFVVQYLEHLIFSTLEHSNSQPKAI